MPRRIKPWEERTAGGQQRLLRFGRRQGWTEEETIEYVESGGSTAEAYGHVRLGTFDEYWAKANRNRNIPDEDKEGALRRHRPGYLIPILEDTEESEREYETNGDPTTGRRRWHSRDQTVPDSFYYYKGKWAI